MGNNETGEHSRKSSNRNSDGGRPFKKAKYAWQLKGKYHLKENHEYSKSYVKEGCSKYSQEGLTDSKNISSNNNNGGSGNNNNCNKCCLNTLMAHSDALLEADVFSDQETCVTNSEASISAKIPVTLVNVNPKSHDDYLYKWQARQMAKSFVDNTINNILEQYKLAPDDAADFVENCANDGQVEDEGILMAIQSHGLHSGKCTSMPFDESLLDNEENVHNENVKQKSVHELEMSCDAEIDEAIYNSNPDLKIGDPMDFLSAAVSVAIQKKGLSSYNYG